MGKRVLTHNFRGHELMTEDLRALYEDLKKLFGDDDPQDLKTPDTLPSFESEKKT